MSYPANTCTYMNLKSRADIVRNIGVYDVRSNQYLIPNPLTKQQSLIRDREGQSRSSERWIPPCTCPDKDDRTTLIKDIQIDSAIMYRNEKPCGKAILNSNLDRSQIFLTTKIPPGSMGYESTKRAINSSLREAAQEYFDL